MTIRAMRLRKMRATNLIRHQRYTANAGAVTELRPRLAATLPQYRKSLEGKSA